MNLPINYTTTHYSIRKQAREQYVKEQDGLCKHCNAPLSIIPYELIKKFPINKALFPAGMFDYPVHLHHCHKTDMTIGAVHAHCNAILWQYKGE